MQKMTVMYRCSMC